MFEAYVAAFGRKTQMDDYIRVYPSVNPYTGDVHIIGSNGNKHLRLDIIKQRNGTYAIFGNRELIQVLGGRSEAGGEGGILQHLHDGKLYDF